MKTYNRSVIVAIFAATIWPAWGSGPDASAQRHPAPAMAMLSITDRVAAGDASALPALAGLIPRLLSNHAAQTAYFRAFQEWPGDVDVHPLGLRALICYLGDLASSALGRGDRLTAARAMDLMARLGDLPLRIDPKRYPPPAPAVGGMNDELVVYVDAIGEDAAFEILRLARGKWGLLPGRRALIEKVARPLGRLSSEREAYRAQMQEAYAAGSLESPHSIAESLCYSRKLRSALEEAERSLRELYRAMAVPAVTPAEGKP